MAGTAAASPPAAALERVALVPVRAVRVAEQPQVRPARRHASLRGLLDLFGVLVVLLVHLLLVGLGRGGDALAVRVAEVVVGAVELLEGLNRFVERHELLVGHVLLGLAVLGGVGMRVLALLRLLARRSGDALAESVTVVGVRTPVQKSELRGVRVAPLVTALLRGVRLIGPSSAALPKP